MGLALRGSSFLLNALKKESGWLDYVKKDLVSDVVRNSIGERTFDFNAEEDGPNFLRRLDPDGIYGFFTRTLKFIGSVNKFGNFLSRKTAGFLAWSATSIFEWGVERYFELTNFDFNATDEEINNSIGAAWKGFLGMAGRFLGTSIVWGAGSVIVGGVAIRWPVIGSNIALEVAREGSQEILASLRNAFMNLVNVTGQSLVKYLFLGARKLELFGLRSIHASDNKKPWTIAEKIDEKVEKLPPGLEEGIRGLLEGVEDSILDFGYVLAFALDDHFETQKFSQQPPPDTERAIRLFVGNNLNEPGVPFDPEPDAPYIYIEGNQDYVIEQADDVMLTTSGVELVVGSKDIGEFMGVPYEEWQRSSPKRANLQIRYYDSDKPPFQKQGARRAIFNIPDPKPLTWEKIKQTAISYTYGPVLTTVKLDNGRQMQCWASSPNEGLNTLKQLLNLSTAKMVGLPAHTEIDDSLLPQNEKKRPAKMTAAFGTYTISRSTNGITDPSRLHSKNRESAKKTFKIWVNTEEESGFERPRLD